VAKAEASVGTARACWEIAGGDRADTRRRDEVVSIDEAEEAARDRPLKEDARGALGLALVLGPAGEGAARRVDGRACGGERGDEGCVCAEV
jgi:hypothetical protein